MPPRTRTIAPSVARSAALDALAPMRRVTAPCACAGDERDLALPPGLRQALRQLNASTRFRFTTLYQCERSRLVGVWVHDRENPRVNGETPRDAPACCYRAAGIVPPPPLAAASDATRGALPDRWHDVHALRQRDGTLLGVLCHSDARPRLVGELAWLDCEPLLFAVAEWLASLRSEAAVARHHRAVTPAFPRSPAPSAP